LQDRFSNRHAIGILAFANSEMRGRWRLLKGAVVAATVLRSSAGSLFAVGTVISSYSM